MKSSANTAKNEVEVLKRKLRETEARVISRLLLSAQQTLPKEQFKALADQFESHGALDLLQMERNLADYDRRKYEEAEKVVEAAEEFMEIYKRCEKYNIHMPWGDEQLKKAEEDNTKKTVKRNKLFSLVDERNMKKRFADQYEGK